MNYRLGKIILGSILTIFSVISLFNCGDSGGTVRGSYLSYDYEASISDIQVTTGVYTVNSDWYSNYAMTDASMQIQMSLNNHWGRYPDNIIITVSDLRSIVLGNSYEVGVSGIAAKMVIDQSPFSPTGTIRFTKLSYYEGKEVCAAFSFYVADGAAGFFEGSFCGTINVGYNY